jgi:LacI family transcriptional regulator
MLDVAKLAGVSPTTVSFVMNHVSTVNIPDQTKERVWDAVRKLGYRRNNIAKALRTKRTHTIGFVTDEIASTPFAGNTIKGAQDAAWANNKILMIVNTGGNEAIKETAVEMMLERQVEGIIYAAWFHRQVNPPAALYEVPAVLVDSFCEDRSLPSVVPDEVLGGRTATEVLLRKGHRRIGFINVGSRIPAAIGRLEGYKQALEAASVPFDPALVRRGNARQDGGYAKTIDLMSLDDHPTALFCGNDRTAMGAYDALRDLKLCVPQDVAVIGFDNQELIAEYLRPPLSTMQLPHYEMGQWAVNYLLEHAEKDEPGPPVQKTIECPYIERQSI